MLNLRPGFPARDGRFAHAQQVRELLLRQGQFLAALANLLRRQQSGRAAEGGADLLIGLVVDAERLAVAALRDRQGGNFDPIIRPSCSTAVGFADRAL